VALFKQNYLSDKYTSIISEYIKPSEKAKQTAIRKVKKIGINLDTLEYGCISNKMTF